MSNTKSLIGISFTILYKPSGSVAVVSISSALYNTIAVTLLDTKLLPSSLSKASCAISIDKFISLFIPITSPSSPVSVSVNVAVCPATNADS